MLGFNHYTDNKPFTTQQSGNIDVGNVSFSGWNLFSSGSSTVKNYSGSFSSFTATEAYWSTGGNGSFKPLAFQVPRGFPIVSDTIVTYKTNTVTLSAGYTLPHQQVSIQNYDSVTVLISGFGINSVQKTFVFGSPVTFTPNELSKLSGSSSAYISVYCFNYTNATINDKKYIFELSSKSKSNFVYLKP
jgi:hypothetical protein